MLDIQNFYEKLVYEQLCKMASHNQEFLQNDFLRDVACVTLNELPSRYVRNLVDLHSHCSDDDDIQMNLQVMAAINRAIEKVKQRPHQGRG